MAAEPPRRSRRTKAIRIALAVLVSAALVATLLRLGGRAAVDRLLRPERPALLLLVLPAYLSGYAFRVLRFRSFAGPCSHRTLTGIVFVHNALNRILPLKVGELSYPVFAARHGISSPGPATLDLLSARLLDLTAMLFALLLAPLYAADFALSPIALWAAAGLLVAGVLLLLGLRRASVSLLRLLRWIAARTPLLRRRLLDRIEILARAAQEEIASRSGPPWGAVALWTLGIWASLILCYDLVVRAFGAGVPLDQLVAGVTGASLAGALPVGAVGNIGVQESGWVILGTAAGMDRAGAIATGLALQAVTLLYAAGLGLFGFAVLLRRPRTGAGVGPDE